MKYIIIIALLSVNFLIAEPVRIQTKLDSVKVYLQGAEISHSAKIKLEKGKNTLKLIGVSPFLIENSIRISAEKEIDIMSVSLKDETKQIEKSAAVLAIEDSIRKNDYKIEEIKNEMAALEDELEMIKSNKTIGGSSGTSVQQIKDMADFFRGRILEIKTKIQKSNGGIAAINERNIKLREDLENTIKAKSNNPGKYIELVVNSESFVSADLVLVYYTGNASWIPEYSIKVKSIASNPEVLYKAKVRQICGIDWEDTDITLSTGNPMLSLNKPILGTVFARLYTKQSSNITYKEEYDSPLSPESSSGYSDRSIRKLEKEMRIDGLDAGKENVTAFNNFVKDFTLEYKPSLKYTILSDNRYFSVNMQKNEAEAKYEYYCAPVLNKEVYLLARIKNWEKLNLMPGEANVIYENSYNGRTNISPAVTDSILKITVAVDKGIIVTRKQMQEYREGKFLSSKNEKTFGFDFTVRNAKDKAIKLIVEDRVPVSNDEDIEIEIKNKSGAEYNAKTGIIKWVIELKPGEKTEKQLVYSVTAPE